MSDGKTLEFIFDFGSPNAYFVHRVLPPLLARTGATLQVTPCLLDGIFKATGNQAPSQAFAGVQGKMDYERLEIDRFIRAHGLSEFRMNPHFSVNTLLPMRGLVAAQMDGEGERYIDGVVHAMWEKACAIDQPPVLEAVLSEARLDAARLLERSAAAEVKRALIENTQLAVDRGVFGIPTFFVGEEMFFGKERLAQVEEELRS